MSEKLLEIKDEKLSFFTPAGEVKALNGVSFSMNEGEVLGIVGESGSGKSVTAYSIMGLTAYPGKLIGGTIYFNGHQIEKMSEKEMRKFRGNEVSLIFQDPMTSLNPVYTIGNQIPEGIRLHTGKSKKEAYDRAKELLELVGIGDKAEAYPKQLSGGQKQRVAIARALAMEPEVLLLDEVTAALDPEMVREVLDVILGLAQEGKTMLIVTHEMQFARAVADRVLFFDGGEIVEQDIPERFFEHPKTERAQKFLHTFEIDAVRQHEA